MPVTQDIVGLLPLRLQLVQLLFSCDVIQQRRFWSGPKDLLNNEPRFVSALAALQMLMVLEILLVPNFLLSFGEPFRFLLLLGFVPLQPLQSPDDVFHIY